MFLVPMQRYPTFFALTNYAPRRLGYNDRNNWRPHSWLRRTVVGTTELEGLFREEYHGFNSLGELYQSLLEVVFLDLLDA